MSDQAGGIENRLIPKMCVATVVWRVRPDTHACTCAHPHMDTAIKRASVCSQRYKRQDKILLCCR
eukprot:bmy_07440T0